MDAKARSELTRTLAAGVGLISLSVGAGLVYLPAAFITAGVVLLGLAVLGALRR